MRSRDQFVNLKKLLSNETEHLSKLGYEYAKEFVRKDGFIIFYIKEPALSIGREKILYPLEFKDVRRFYTSDIPIEVSVKPFISDRGGDQILRAIKERARKYSVQYNFHISFESATYNYSVDNCISNIRDYIRNMSQQDPQTNRIVMLITRSLGKHRFSLIKAYGVYYRVPTHIINLDTVDEIIGDCEARDYEDAKGCPGFNAYLLNNYVQLYAKAGGTPWVASDEDSKMLNQTIVIGLAASRLGNTGYVAGISYAIAYMGKEIRSFVYSEVFEERELDLEFLKTKGLYIPANVIKRILSNMKNAVKGFNINRYIIFQTTIIHPDEVKGISEALKDETWLLVHVKSHGFPKRVYDLNSDDYGSRRGVCIVDEESTSNNAGIKALLLTTGVIKVRERDRKTGELVEKEKRLYKKSTTPRPLELELLHKPKASTAIDSRTSIGLILYVCRLVLLLNKLDWEAYTTWPKSPFVVKYAERIAEILSTLYQQGDEESINLAKSILSALQNEPRALRYIM